MWGMKLNPRKTHSITISRSRIPYPLHPPLTLCGINLEVSSFLKLLGVTLDVTLLNDITGINNKKQLYCES